MACLTNSARVVGGRPVLAWPIASLDCVIPTVSTKRKPDFFSSARMAPEFDPTDFTLPSNLPVNLPLEIAHRRPAPRWCVPTRFLAPRLCFGVSGLAEQVRFSISLEVIRRISVYIGMLASVRATCTDGVHR